MFLLKGYVPDGYNGQPAAQSMYEPSRSAK